MKTFAKPLFAAPMLAIALAACSGGSDDADTDADRVAQPVDTERLAPDTEDDGRIEARFEGDRYVVDLPEGVSQDQLGERTTQMIAVQTLLDRSRHSPGVIDGRGGGNTDRAIAFYREANDLPAGSQVDTALLRSLHETQGGDIFRRYTIKDSDVEGPFYDIPSGFGAKAELEELGYEDAHELLAEKFHMDQDFLAALNPDADFSRAGTEIVVVHRDNSPPPGDIARIEVRKAEDAAVALAADGSIVASYPATIGSSDFPSPSGSMTVAAVAPEPNYTFDPDDLSWGPNKTFILPPGPNNPVGGTWIDLSKDGYGIHGSPDPQLIGKTASHGCVRLTNWDAEELGEKVKTGTEVVFV